MMIITRLHPKESNEEEGEILYRNAEDELFEQGAEFKIEWNAEADIRQDEQNGAGWEDEELYTQEQCQYFFSLLSRTIGTGFCSLRLL